MKLFQKRTLHVTVIAAAVAVIALLSPRAAHAVASALVQVTNTLSNPVISQGSNTAAGQMILLTSDNFSGILSGQPTSLYQLAPAMGTVPNVYVVPAGQSLVVTGIDATPTADANAEVVLYSNCPSSSGPVQLANFNANTAYTTTLARYPGIPIPAGCYVQIQYMSTLGELYNVQVYGYLTTI